jgi:hypothetical protein
LFARAAAHTEDFGSRQKLNPSLPRIRCISSATSGSSRLISRGPRSMTVTRLPKRR